MAVKRPPSESKKPGRARSGRAAADRSGPAGGEDDAAASPQTAEPAASPTPIVVGMVASAGGLEAFKGFFRAMPADSGMAFVLIPHLDPKHESLMAPLLAKQTAMPVTEAEEGQRLEADHVYVIPPNRYLSLHEGVIQLSPPPERGVGGTAIDPFLRSLADDQHERAVCIILSGTGSHGSLGLKAVKAAGGMAMVQDPSTAQYDRMPISAVETGLADYVLPPGRMPEELLKYVQHYVVAAAQEPESVPDDLSQVLALLRARTHFDFRAYRKRMLLRRVRRRMGLNHLDRIADYLAMLRERPDELAQLSKDLLISVTSFFRDPGMYQVMEARVLSELVDGRDAHAPIRVWVPGCATGEEAYSIAMLLIERISASGKACPLQVFASDVDESAIEAARRGIYPEAMAADLPRERLERFFTRADANNWQVNRQLRESVLFASQNILADAPFSRLDLVSCRNLLIYLEPEVQQKLLQLFHFALNDGGYLILGPSESIGRQTDRFEAISKQWRIFRRLGVTGSSRGGFPVVPREHAGEPRSAAAPVSVLPRNLAEVTRKMLLEEYAPAAVVINRRYEVLHYSGPTQLYLQHPGGPPSQDLLTLALAALRARVRAAVMKALSEDARVDVGGIRVKRAGRPVLVRLAVHPLQARQGEEGLLLVTFQDEPEVSVEAAGGEGQAASDERQLRQLEYELKTSREELQTAVEELESSNEELKASNEEVMSMNEELQSTNEELETSKEELQSLNEELTTVNAQLRDKVDELEGANNDMTNLLASVETVTLFLGVDRTLQRFTPSATRLFNVIASDVGRPIEHITARFEDPDLSRDIDEVLRNLTPCEREVSRGNAQWFLRRLTPYRTMDNRINGVVLTLSDVTRIKHAELELRHLTENLEKRVRARTAELETEIRERQQAERALRQSEQKFRALFNDAPVGMFQADTENGRLLTVNPRLCSMIGYGEAELLGRPFREIVHPDDRDLEAYLRLEGGKVPGYQAEGRLVRKDGSILWIDLRATLVRDESDRALHALAVIADITERKRLQTQVAEQGAQLHQERNFIDAILNTAGALILVLDTGARVVRFNAACNPATGRDFAHLLGTADWLNLVPAEEREGVRAALERLQAGEDHVEHENHWMHRDGSRRLLHWKNSVLRDESGKVQYIIGTGVDITEQRKAESRAREHLEAASRLQRMQTANELATLLAHELNQPLAAIATYAGACMKLLRRTPLEEEKLTRNLEQISRQSLRAGDAIRHMRAFVGRGRIQPVPVDLNAVLRSTCALMEAKTRARGVGIRLDLAEGLPPVMGVDVHIEQVLLNLLRNAMDAIRDAGMEAGSIDVATRAVDGMAQVSVRDSGPGMDEEMAARVFEPLSSRKEYGLGVGLRISRSLIEAHGGRLWVEPHVPGGVFHFVLPLAP